MIFLLGAGKRFEMITNLTIYNTAGLLLFGYAVFEKGFSGWWFLAYIGISMIFYGMVKKDDRKEWSKKSPHSDT